MTLSVPFIALKNINENKPKTPKKQKNLKNI